MIQDNIKFKGKTIDFVYPDELATEIKTQKLEMFQNEQYKNGIRGKNLVYLDIGANIGLATTYFQPYAKKIYSIEPNPDIFAALVENTKKFNNVERFNLAMGNVNGYDYMFSNAGGSLPQTFYGDDTSIHQIKVKVAAMDTFLKENNINHVDVMKIDVEGAEFIILASDSFLRVADKIDYIIGESHYIYGGFPDALLSILKDAGFNKARFIPNMKPNYFRDMEYTEIETGKKKKWIVPYNTMFEAWRE